MNDKNWRKVRNLEEQRTEFELPLGCHYKHQIVSGHLLFTLSRYKFASKLLERSNGMSVLELGCNEGIGTLQLALTSKKVVAVDSDKRAIDWSRRYLPPACRAQIDFIQDDFLGKKYGKFDAVVSIDVIEHIARAKEKQFLTTVYDNLKPEGFCVIGTPNITSSKYASKTSRQGHINLYDAKRLEALLSTRFHNVFMFGMNDEVVHTGFKPMRHYLMALACSKK